MYQLICIFLMSVLSITSAEDQPTEYRLMVKKLVDIRSMSVKEFSRLNKAHIDHSFITEETVKEHKNNFYDLMYAGNIVMGSAEQTLRVFFDMTSADLVVLSASYCKSLFMKLVSPTCWSHGSYSETKSIRRDQPVWDNVVSPTFQIPYGKGALKGRLIFDEVKIANVVIPSTLFGLLERWDYAFPYSRADGVLGIGPTHRSHFRSEENFKGASDSDKEKVTAHTPVINFLRNKFGTVGFYLYKSNSGNEVGQIIFGAKDDSHKAFKNLEWVNVVKSTTTFWQFTMSKVQVIRMHSGEFEIAVNQEFHVIPDPGTSTIAGPPALIEAIHQKLFIGLDSVKRTIKYGTVQFECRYRDQLPILVSVIGSKGYFLEPKDYVKQLNGKCTTGFLAVESLTVMVMGDSFFQRHYTVYDNKNNRIGFTESIVPDKLR